MQNDASTLAVRDLRHVLEQLLEVHANGVARIEKQLKDLVNGIDHLYSVIGDLRE